MRHYIQLFVPLFVMLGLVSCTEQPDGSQYAADPELTISPTSVEFPVGGGTQRIFVQTDGTVLAGSESKWLTTSVDGSVVVLTAPRNESLDSRHSRVTIVSGGEAATLQVIQFGLDSDHLWPVEYTFPYQGGDLVLTHDKDGGFWFDIDVDWLSVEFDEGQITISAEKNPWKESRTGTIKWTVGDESGTIVFTQEGNPDSGEEGGGGTGGGNEGENDPYKAWIGNWTIQREDWEYDENARNWTGNHSTVTDTWQITKKEDGKTFYIMGMENLEYSYDTDDMAVVAQFDAATGAIKVYEQTFTTWSADGENYTDALFARFHYAGDDTYQEGDYVNGRSDLIFTATLNGSKATLTPGSGDNGTFVSFQYFQVPATGNSFYVYNREGYPLANTLTKASGSNIVQRSLRLSEDTVRAATRTAKSPVIPAKAAHE